MSKVKQQAAEDAIDEVIPPPDPEMLDALEPLAEKLAETGDEDYAEQAIAQLGAIALLGPKKGRRTPEQWADMLGRWYLRTEGDVAALKAKYQPIIKALEADIASLEGTQKFIKLCISKLIPGGEGVGYVNESVALSYTESTATECVDPKLTPFEFMRIDPNPPPDKVGIGAALKANKEVPGWALKTNWNLQVKRGGLKAIESWKKKQKKLAEERKVLEEMMKTKEKVEAAAEPREPVIELTEDAAIVEEGHEL